MADRAQVTSVEAVESFRASLIVFQSRARVVLEEACDEVLRTKVWVQTDRRRYWTAEARRRGNIPGTDRSFGRQRAFHIDAMDQGECEDPFGTFDDREAFSGNDRCL